MIFKGGRRRKRTRRRRRRRKRTFVTDNLRISILPLLVPVLPENSLLYLYCLGILRKYMLYVGLRYRQKKRNKYKKIRKGIKEK